MITIARIEIPHGKKVFHRIRDFNQHMLDKLRDKKSTKVDEYVRITLQCQNEEELPTVMANVTFIRDAHTHLRIDNLRAWAESEYGPTCFQPTRGRKVYRAIVNWDTSLIEDLQSEP